METIRLTAAQATVRFLENQFVELDGDLVRYFAGVWAIFGHGNVTGLGEALAGSRDTLPTYRANNEQGMAHAAIAYAKTLRRQRAMVCTTSIGPGATNMVTAAAVAHVDRLPLLLLPGDIFADRAPDPVLQQVESFSDGTVSANDCFRPVSRYFDRITRPEQIINALQRAMSVLMDPAECGPVTLAMAQDVQAEAFDYPVTLFEPRVWRQRRQPADQREQARLAELVRAAKKPLIIAGGGVIYSGACDQLAALATVTGIPVCETHAGKSSLPWDHPKNLGAVGVTGGSAANEAAQVADLVIAVGSRMQDFTTGSWTLFQNPDVKLVQINVGVFDAHKKGAIPVVGDARTVLEALARQLDGWRVVDDWSAVCTKWRDRWLTDVDSAVDYHTVNTDTGLPSDADIIGVVGENAAEDAILVCAAGGLPGELHKLWKASKPGGYHMEYGYSCMGYEIAGGLGASMAAPERDVIVMVGDGSYLMMNSEIATAAMMGVDLTIVLLDNRGFGCINRLQQSKGSQGFNNLFEHSQRQQMPDVDFVAHAASMGATAVKADSAADLAGKMKAASGTPGVKVFVVETDPLATTEAGGHWWDVPVAEISENGDVAEALTEHIEARCKQRLTFQGK